MIPQALRVILPAVAILCASSAQAIGVGLEGGATATFSSFASGYSGPSTAGGATAGLIVDEEYTFLLLFMDFWADVQTPTLRFQTGGVDSAQYLPVDLGVRAGLNFAVLHPYVGLLGQMAVEINDGGGPSPTSPLFGVGADVGLDVAVWVFRFGVELRGVDVLSPIIATSAGQPSGAYELQGLGSARVSF